MYTLQKFERYYGSYVLWFDAARKSQRNAQILAAHTVLHSVLDVVTLRRKISVFVLNLQPLVVVLKLHFWSSYQPFHL